MIRALIKTKIQSAVDSLVRDGRLPHLAYPDFEITDTKQPEHGDLTTNWAKVSVKTVAGGGGPANPRALGELLASELLKDSDFSKVEVAGPGFVNLSLANSVFGSLLGLVQIGSEGSILENASH